MFRKILFAAFLVSVLAATGYAADMDNAAVAPSYFEGVWAGSWGGFVNPSIHQDVTVTIGKRGGKGFFPVEYAWGGVDFRNRTVLPGSLKTKGVEEGGRFSFRWKNKEGREFEVTLHKQKENEVKARLDRGGPLSPTEQPYSETVLRRK